jgi:hypothetical protein
MAIRIRKPISWSRTARGRGAAFAAPAAAFDLRRGDLLICVTP